MSTTRLILTAGFLAVLSISSVEAQGPPGGAMGFISRLDANKNGQLDPNEQGRARPFLERIARETGGLDLNRPIPLQTLASKVQQMQGGGGGDQNRDRSRSRDRGSQPARNSGDRRFDDDAAAATEGLVQGFNEIPEDLVPPVGFGSKAEYLNVDVIQADFVEAENTIKRYDRNRDGILDQEEIRNAKWLYGNPMNQDRNGDGRLTKSELAVRYSIRRDTQKDQAREKAFQESQKPKDNNQQSRGGPPQGGDQSRSRRGGGDSGGGDRMAQFADSIFQRYDSNKSGVFEKDEWKNFRTDPSGWDFNKDGKITREELVKGMSERFGGGRSSGGENGSQRGRTTWNGDKGPAGGGSGESPNSYRFKTAHDLLPEGIPQWFREGDKNKDGQIAMSEYSGQWNEKTLSEYYVYDRNRDGLLTVGEVMAAKETGFVRGVTPPPKTPSGDSPRVTNQTQERGSRSSEKGSESSEKGSESSSESKGPDERYVKYAVMTIGRYDENKDGVLSLDEIKDAKNVKAEYDQNKDGKLTPAEIATGWSKK